MIEYLIAGLLVVAAIVLVAYPMLTQKKYLYALQDIFELGDDKQLRYLDSKKATILDNLKELDFEYEMGKLAEDDYQRLRHGYLTEAQEVVHALDQLKAKKEIEDLIESDARSRRRIQ